MHKWKILQCHCCSSCCAALVLRNNIGIALKVLTLPSLRVKLRQLTGLPHGRKQWQAGLPNSHPCKAARCNKLCAAHAHATHACTPRAGAGCPTTTTDTHNSPIQCSFHAPKAPRDTTWLSRRRRHGAFRQQGCVVAEPVGAQQSWQEGGCNCRLACLQRPERQGIQGNQA